MNYLLYLVPILLGFASLGAEDTQNFPEYDPYGGIENEYWTTIRRHFFNRANDKLQKAQNKASEGIRLSYANEKGGVKDLYQS